MLSKDLKWLNLNDYDGNNKYPVVSDKMSDTNEQRNDESTKRVT